MANPTPSQPNMRRAKSAFRKMTPQERAELMKWQVHLLDKVQPQQVDEAFEMRSKGGRARMAQLSPKQRKFARANGVLGGTARAKALTPERRAEIASAAGKASARRAKKEAKKVASV